MLKAPRLARELVDPATQRDRLRRAQLTVEEMRRHRIRRGLPLDPMVDPVFGGPPSGEAPWRGCAHPWCVLRKVSGTDWCVWHQP